MFPANGQGTALLLGWVQEWRAFMEAEEQDAKGVEASESLKSRLFDPIRVSGGIRLLPNALSPLFSRATPYFVRPWHMNSERRIT